IGPSSTMGAVILLCRRAATKVIVFHSPCGTWLISRSPREQRPLRRTKLVVTAVSSLSPRRLGVAPLTSSFFFAWCHGDQETARARCGCPASVACASPQGAHPAFDPVARQ